MQQRRIAVGLGLVVVGLAGRWSIAEAPVRATKTLDAGGAGNSVRLVLPTSIPAVVGTECKLDFDNVVLVAPVANACLFDDCETRRSIALSVSQS